MDKYQAHLAQFKKVLASLQRGAGRALRRRSLAALQNCTVVAVLEPRLYAFEVSLAWSHMGAEYRVALFSKLKSKDWPNPASLLGSLAEILQNQLLLGSSWRGVSHVSFLPITQRW